MAWTRPSEADFRNLFPAFKDVMTIQIQQAFLSADGQVNAEWAVEGDYRLGFMYYAAHVLTLMGLGEGADAEMARAGTLAFTSIKDGQVSVTRDPGIGKRTLMQTQYGRLYADIQRRNVRGPRVATG